MREVIFLRKNEKKWRDIEELLSYGSSSINPDKLADMYVELTDDLAFSQTNYPDSKTTVYLNGITAEVYQAVYKNKKEKSNRIINFWRYELPKEFFYSQKQLLYSFLIFALFVLIGAVSTAHDENFPRVILGDDYINMTLENIDKGDPMAVYKGEANSMFYGITTNNIKVSFLIFVAGVGFINFSPFMIYPFTLGTIYLLFINGIMLGAFQWFFYDKGLFLTSFLTIWIHGTLEISAIIIGGAAGFVVGNSILFPGTLSRMESVVKAGKRAVKISIGLVPIFVVAGFLESYVTRLTEMPIYGKLAIIISSFSFIIYYFVILPIRLNRRIGIIKRDVYIHELTDLVKDNEFKKTSQVA